MVMRSLRNINVKMYRFGLLKSIYWKIFGAVTITLPLPTPSKIKDEATWDSKTSRYVYLTHGPVDAYLPWLVNTFGDPGLNWEWYTEVKDVYSLSPITVVHIVFRRGKESEASMVLLKWGNGND